MKKFLFFLAIFAALVWTAVYSFPDHQLHLVFCDVGQGDAILIKKGFTQILIDAGPDERVLACLADQMPFWDRRLEMAVLTHPQADHLTGFISVLERYEVKRFVINNLINDTELFWRFRKSLIDEGAEIYNPKAGERIKIGKIFLTILWPEEKLGDVLVWQKEKSREKILAARTYAGDLNEISLVLLLSYGDFEALLTGDIGQSAEKKLEVGEVEVLKVAHHGSQYSTSLEFLEQVRPELAVISVGKNRWGHPASEVLHRLRAVGSQVLRTDRNGKIKIISDGDKWRILPDHL